MSTKCSIKVNVQFLYTIVDWKKKRAEVYFRVNEKLYRIRIKNYDTDLEAIA
jgi:uncharacterized protein (UPF0218 family)